MHPVQMFLLSQWRMKIDSLSMSLRLPQDLLLPAWKLDESEQSSQGRSIGLPSSRLHFRYRYQSHRMGSAPGPFSDLRELKSLVAQRVPPPHQSVRHDGGPSFAVALSGRGDRKKRPSLLAQHLCCPVHQQSRKNSLPLALQSDLTAVSLVPRAEHPAHGATHSGHQECPRGLAITRSKSFPDIVVPGPTSRHSDPWTNIS